MTLPDRAMIEHVEYRRHPAAGSTDLKNMLRSPAHYKQEHDHPRESTHAQKLGAAIHRAVLEPELFESTVAIVPKFEGKGARASMALWEKQHEGKLLLKPDESAVVDGILGSLLNHETARDLLREGRSEESFFWQDPMTGLVCKCRPDLWKDGLIVDVKTTVNASPQEFPRTIANLMYHLQAAYYLDGVSAVLGESFERFAIVAIEKEPPYAVATYVLDEASLEVGRRLYRKALRLLRQCKQHGVYPAYPDRLLAAALPPWAWPADSFDRVENLFPQHAS